MSKGSTRRPSFIPQDEYGRRYTQTFTERELANDFREHHKRLIRAERRKADNTMTNDSVCLKETHSDG